MSAGGRSVSHARLSSSLPLRTPATQANVAPGALADTSGIRADEKRGKK